MIAQSRIYRGFTITEVMLAGFLLTVGLVAVMSLFVVAHRHTRDAQDVIIATELAQEGLEIARNIRDNRIAYRVANWATCNGSTAGACDPFYDFPNGNGRIRTVDYNATSFTDPGNKFLSYSGSNLYYHGAGTSSGFWRVLRIDHGGPPDTPVRVQSFVSWASGQSNSWNPTIATCNPYNQCVYAESLLTPWQ